MQRRRTCVPSTPVAAGREAIIPPRSTEATRGAWLLVAAVVLWNLVTLRALTLGVSYLDDSSVHEQMVRFATRQFQSGHLPLTSWLSWFPFLGLGSPQFLHYQSLPMVGR